MYLWLGLHVCDHDLIFYVSGQNDQILYIQSLSIMGGGGKKI